MQGSELTLGAIARLMGNGAPKMSRGQAMDVLMDGLNL
jgi:hypothetical protein